LLTLADAAQMGCNTGGGTDGPVLTLLLVRRGRAGPYRILTPDHLYRDCLRRANWQRPVSREQYLDFDELAARRRQYTGWRVILKQHTSIFTVGK
jgi:hypothetical protein